ncbi:MAG: LysR family transcriptional regulator [Acidovorax sp.]|jgi:aminoethylphosphonate catabolism LysR family transcriptional regulator|nr:LysR family transcriptional regulator [Acidovorax sp.]MDR3005730.1 LysR family transcriptional regulator [Acidovorax sp.]
MFVTQLQSFFWVARLGSITLAARQLGLSQPTVTTQVRALEAHYGVELFHRQGGRLSLSGEGLQLMPQVEQLLLQTVELESALRHAGDGSQGGQLRIGATAPYYVLDIVQRFGQQFPRVQLSIVSGNSQQMVQALSAFQVDLATSSTPETDPRLLRLELGQDPLALVVHRSHRLARRTQVEVAELAQETVILREPGSVTRRLTEQLLADAGVAPARVLEIASREGIREAVIRAMGVSAFARHEATAHPELVVLPFAGPVPHLPEYLYCLHSRSQAPLIAAFLAASQVEMLQKK